MLPTGMLSAVSPASGKPFCCHRRTSSTVGRSGMVGTLAQTPSRPIRTGRTSYRSRSRLSRMPAADWHDTSCSPLRPPNRTASRIFGSDTHRLLGILGAAGARVDVVACHPRADSGDDLVWDGVRPPGPVGHGRLSL